MASSADEDEELASDSESESNEERPSPKPKAAAVPALPLDEATKPLPAKPKPAAVAGTLVKQLSKPSITPRAFGSSLRASSMKRVAEQPRSEEPTRRQAFFTKVGLGRLTNLETQSLQSLGFQHAEWAARGIDAADCEHVLASLIASRKELSILRTLNLGANRIQNAGLRSICSALQAADSSTETDDPESGPLEQGLPMLQVLNLDHNDISASGVSALQVLISGQLNSLTCFSLNGNRLGDEGVSMLVTILASNGVLPCLDELQLMDNQIGERGMQGIAQAARHSVRSQKNGWDSRALESISLLRLDGNAPLSSAAANELESAMSVSAALGKLNTLFLTVESNSPSAATDQAYAKLRAVVDNRKITLHCMPWRPSRFWKGELAGDPATDAATGTTLPAGNTQVLLDARLSSMMEEVGVSLSANVDFGLGPGGRDPPDPSNEDDENAFE